MLSNILYLILRPFIQSIIKYEPINTFVRLRRIHTDDGIGNRY